MIFTDRAEAGKELAKRLGHLRRQPTVVLGLPRGGVPVAAEVARALGAPLDVIVVRKLGVPFQPELAMGAVGEDGARVIDPDVMHLARVSADELSAIEARERAEVDRRARRYRARRKRVQLTGQVAVRVLPAAACTGQEDLSGRGWVRSEQTDLCARLFQIV